VIVAEVRTVLSGRKQATPDQIAADLGAGRDLVREALRFWVDRGNVRRIFGEESGGACSTRCGGCPLSGACSVGGESQKEVEFYEWISSERRVTH